MVSLQQKLFLFRKKLIQDMITYCSINEGINGLDIGCSIGAITKLLSDAQNGNGTVTGIDFDNNSINTAEKSIKSSQYEELVHFHKMDMNSLSFDSESFDWIWAMDSLWIGSKEYGCPSNDPFNLIKKI